MYSEQNITFPKVDLFRSSACKVCRNSSLGIATRYELGGPGIESRWGRDFQHTSRPTRALTASCTIGTGSLPGVKRPKRGAVHPPISSAEFKERIEIHLFSPSGPTWPVRRVTFTFTSGRKTADRRTNTRWTL